MKRLLVLAAVVAGLSVVSGCKTTDTSVYFQVHVPPRGDVIQQPYAWVLYRMDRKDIIQSEWAAEIAQQHILAPAGLYGLDVYTNGSAYRKENIEIKDGKRTQFHARLTAGGDIQGIVIGKSSGRPLPGVSVFRPLDRGYTTEEDKTWKPEDSLTASIVERSDDTGHYILKNLPPGRQLIVYHMPNLGWAEQWVEVVEGKVVEAPAVEITKN